MRKRRLKKRSDHLKNHPPKAPGFGGMVLFYLLSRSMNSNRTMDNMA